VLKRCHDSYIHTAIETSGYVPWKYFKENLEHLDWIFFNIKHMDPAIHRKGTGVSNELILKNAENLAALKEPRLIFRITIIPGYNDTPENITATARFLKKIDKDEINILPFHQLGASKYGHLGRPCGHNRLKPCPPEKLLKFKKTFELFDVRCYLGNNTPF
jgi:pyruvate formate lyase activating enzyme